MPKLNSKYIIARNGKDIVYKILIIEFNGITTYSFKVGEHKGNDIYRDITKDEYNHILNLANEKGYFIYEKKAK